MSWRRAVMIVEDDPNDRFLIRKTIEKAHLNSLFVFMEDGQKAIEYLRGEGAYGEREKHPLPTLVVTDLKMPRVGGFELLEWIKGQPQLERLKVVVLSSSAKESDMTRASALGALAYWVKPCNWLELVDKLRQVEGSLSSQMAEQDDSQIQSRGE